MNFRDLVEKVRKHDQHEPYDCDCLLCRLFRDLYETNYTIFFSPDVSRMNQEAYDAGKTAASADLAAAALAKAREEGWWEGQKEMLNDVQRWWRCACETHPVRSQRDMNRNQFFMTALLNELQYPSALLAEKEEK